MKNIILIFILLFAGNISAQNMGIISSNFQLSGIFNGERVAWKSDVTRINVDKSTGEFKAYISIDDLLLVEESENFESGSEKKQRKTIVLSCQLPITQFIEDKNETLSVDAEMLIEYNDLEVISNFKFTILTLNKKGVSIISQGTFDHTIFDVEGLKGFDNELYIIWSLIGV